MKQRSSTILLVLIFLVGLSLLLYPPISSHINALHQTTAVTEYSNDVSGLDPELSAQIIGAAREYNERLSERGVHFELSEEESADYNEQLLLPSTTVMGFISIPSIDCELPIYHGTDEGTLLSGVGHIEWSALPVGGEGTHCVLSGHRGLPSARLFTDLDRVVLGDIFQITVLNEVLTYEVDQILIVEPEDTSELLPVEGKDYCTLITCTPYGVNSHRMLVRGVRIANPDKAKGTNVTSNAVRIEPIIIAPLLAIPVLLVLLLGLLLGSHRRKKEERSHE